MKAEGRKTSLYDRHVRARARMVEFAGWAMPVQYAGILEEHRHVRSSCGLFDLTHMGEFELTGPTALEDVQRLLTNDVAAAHAGQCVYSPMCHERGGIVDDLIAYRYEDGHVMLVVNASNHDKDLDWVKGHVRPTTQVVDRSFEISLLALQGPKALQVLAPHVADLEALRTYHFREVTLAGAPVLLSRTGYTGEDGFEVYCDNETAPRLWDLFAADARVAPIGLGARDTLRFEARLMLYGNDLDEETTPLEAGLSWTVKLEKGDFIGRDALVKQKEAGGPERRLVGFRMVGRGIARHGHELVKDGRKIGHVSSGSFAPSLDQNLGLGYVAKEFTPVGTRFEVQIRNSGVEAEVVKTPFYKRPTAEQPKGS